MSSSSDRRKQVILRLDDGDYEALKAASYAAGKSMNAIAIDALRSHLTNTGFAAVYSSDQSGLRRTLYNSKAVAGLNNTTPPITAPSSVQAAIDILGGSDEET